MNKHNKQQGDLQWIQRIRHLRSKLGQTQSEFAQALGTSQITVARWETGKSRPDRRFQDVITELEIFDELGETEMGIAILNKKLKIKCPACHGTILKDWLPAGRKLSMATCVSCGGKFKFWWEGSEWEIFVLAQQTGVYREFRYRIDIRCFET